MEEEDIKLPNTSSWDDTMFFTKQQVKDYAIEAVKLNTIKQPKQELIPFDLEAAKDGAPIITRDGRKAKFVAYVPEAVDGHRVIAFAEGNKSAYTFFDCGSYYKNRQAGDDLFMTPKPMRTVYVNFYRSVECYFYETEHEARRVANSQALAVAVPVQIPIG